MPVLFPAPNPSRRYWRAGSEQPIVVENYGGAGPADLWTMSAAIEGVASRVNWK